MKVTVSFSLATFKILCFNPGYYNYVVPWGVLPWVQPLWDSLSFLDFLGVCFLCQIGEVLHYFSNKFSVSFLLFLFSFWYPYDLDVGTFKVVLEVPKPLLSFLNSYLFILFWSNVYFFLLVQIVDLSPGFLPFTVGSLYIFLYLTFHSLHFFLYFTTMLNHFCEHPDYQCFELCI